MQRRFLGFLMRCGYADDPWEFWVLSLVFVFLKYVFFCVHPCCNFLCYKFFNFSGQCVASVEILMCSLLLPLSILLTLRSLQKRICAVVIFVRKKLSSQIGSFHWLLVLATECFFSFDIFEKHSDIFWDVNALLVC